jgi:hypothetical protein
VTDLDLGFNIACAPTGSAFIGSSCNLSTSADTLTAGTVREGKRSIWETRHVRVFDGGPDGDADTADNTLFAVQGLFAP